MSFFFHPDNLIHKRMELAQTLQPSIISRILSVKGRYYFLILCGLIAFNIFLSNEFIMTRKVYYQTFGEQVALERIDRFFKIRDQLQWLSYAFVPVILLLKVSFVAVCIDIGMLFTKGEGIQFRKLFRAALVSEFIFVTALYIKTGWLTLVADVRTLYDIQKFYPFSLRTVFPDAPDWLAYPLLTANLFELAYIASVAACISVIMNQKFGRSLVLTFFSYGTGLLLWMMLIVFLSINLS
jgi:hypothetical protein